MFNEFSEAMASGDLQLVVESSLGNLIILGLAILLFLALLVFAGSGRVEGNRVKVLAYSGVAIAIAMVLSQVKLFALPQGGTITPFSMLFVVIIGYFFGVRQGILAGLVYGLLQLAFGGWVMHPVQLLLDYPLAFGALGLSGLFANSDHGLIKGLVVGVMGRFFMHFLSGVVFFSAYAPEGWNSVLYSFYYNFSYTGVEAALTIVVLLVPGVMVAFKNVKKASIA